MATLEEIHGLFNHPGLIVKVGAALVIGVKTVLDATPTANDRAYASKVFKDPHAEAHRVLKYILAANNTATEANITGASQVAVQANVDAAIPIMAAADAGA